MKAFVYLFLFAILFRPALPFLDYVVNYQYIATELCENKNNPKIGCNGKCHLQKELIKAYKNDVPSSSEKRNLTTETVVLFMEHISLFLFEKKKSAIGLKINSIYNNLYSHVDSSLIFHPPILTY